jgi:hypothetical protein
MALSGLREHGLKIRRGRKRPGTRHVPFPQFNQERQSGKTQFFHHFRISVAIHENGTFPRGGEPFFRVIDKAHLLLDRQSTRLNSSHT